MFNYCFQEKTKKISMRKNHKNRRMKKTTVKATKNETLAEEDEGINIAISNGEQGQQEIGSSNEHLSETEENDFAVPGPRTRPSFCCRRPLRKNSASMINLPGSMNLKGRIGSSNDWFVTTTEQLLKKHAYKTQLLELLQTMDRALSSFQSGQKESFIQGVETLIKLTDDVWRMEKIGVELIDDMCDHFRRTGNFDLAIRTFIENKMDVQTKVGELLESFLSTANRDYLIQAGYLKEFIKAVILYGFDDREHRRRIGLALLEHFLRINSDTCKIIVDLGCLDLMLETCK